MGTKRRTHSILAAVTVLLAAGPVSPGGAMASGGSVVGAVVVAGAPATPADAVVWIRGLAAAPGDVDPPSVGELVLDQKDMHFVPHVLVVPVGASVTVRNSDAVLHNVHARSKLNRIFNLAMLNGMTRTVRFTEPEVIPIGCDVHSEMSAFVVVTENSFFARPDEAGRFSISDVPPGSYTLQAWHESAGAVDQPITVRDGNTVTVDLTLGD